MIFITFAKNAFIAPATAPYIIARNSANGHEIPALSSIAQSIPPRHASELAAKSTPPLISKHAIPTATVPVTLTIFNIPRRFLVFRKLPSFDRKKNSATTATVTRARLTVLFRKSLLTVD
jgi:hypothetical protein